MNRRIKNGLVIGMVFLLCLGGAVEVRAEENLIDLEVRNANINDVLMMVSEQTGVNIIPDSTLEGQVTLNLKEVSVEDIFESLSLSYGYHFEEVEADTYYISQEEISSLVVKEEDGLLTLRVIKEDIRKVLNEIAREAGVDIVMDDMVSGEVSINIEAAPLDEALEIFLQTNGFSLSKTGNLYRVISTGNRERESGLSVSVVDGKVSIDVERADLAEVLREIGRLSDIDMVMFGNLRQTIDLKLDEVTIEEAIRIALSGTNFAYKKEEDRYLIGSKSSGSPAASLLTTSEVIPLKHIKAEKVPPLLPPQFSGSDIEVIKEQNAILAHGTQTDLRNLKDHIEKIDNRVEQIVVEALILEVSQGEGHSPVAELMMEYEEDSTFLDTSLGRLTYQSVMDLPEEFILDLQALISEEQVTIKGRPNITTLSGQQASIDVGDVQYYRTRSESDEDEAGAAKAPAG